MPTSPATKSPLNIFSSISRRTWWWVAGSVGVILMGIGIFGAVAYAAPGTKIVRGVTIASHPVGGLDTLTAIHQLESTWAAFQAQAFQFQAPGRTMTILVTADSATE